MGFYGYPNARVRAMKSMLLGKDFFENLLKAKDNEEIINMLSKTNYRKDIEAGLLRFPGSPGIEEGLKLNIIKDYQKILKFIKGNSQAERLVTIILSHWDVHNLKTILRGMHAGASKEEISDQLVPVGQLDQAHLSILLQQDEIKACIDMLALWRFKIARPLTKIYRQYAQTNKLSILELEIDKYYFNTMLENIDKKRFFNDYNEELVRRYIGREIDFINIMTLLRLVSENIQDPTIDYSNYFIQGGNVLKIRKLVELKQETQIEDVVEKLSYTPYSAILREGLKKYHFKGSLSSLERVIEDYNTKKLVGLFKDDPLSIAIIIAYIWAKYNEMVNLRIILKGKEVEMPDDQIREELVFV